MIFRRKSKNASLPSLSLSLRLDYQCFTCDKNFKTMKILRRHIERQHIEKVIPNDRTFACYQCQIPFRSLGETRHHLNKHHIVTRKIKCTICKIRITHRDFEQHLCFNLQLIQCEYCVLSFTTTLCLMKHLENFHDEKQLYRCEHCPRFFAMAILKDYHTGQHTIVAKAFACELCPKRYVSKATLMNHMKTHALKHRKFEFESIL